MFQKKQLIWSKLVGGWKKLCGFVKMKTRREEVSTATRLNVFFWKGIPVIFVSGMSGHHCFKNTKMNYINLNKNKPSYLFVKWPFATKVETFQQLCLILNPMLQVGGLEAGMFCGWQVESQSKTDSESYACNKLNTAQMLFWCAHQTCFFDACTNTEPYHNAGFGRRNQREDPSKACRKGGLQFQICFDGSLKDLDHALIYCATDLKTIGKTFSETAMIERWFYFIWFCLKTI